MSKLFSGNWNVGFAKVLAIAIMFSMALSVVPMAQAQDACSCAQSPESCDHECAAHAQEGCACNHEGAGHDAETLTALAQPGGEITSTPAPAETSGFPVWIDQSVTGENLVKTCGVEHDQDCPNCDAGTVPCTTCMGAGDITCPTCGGSGQEDCPSCVGGWVDCPSCVGGTNECTVCGGDGLVSCTWCGG